MPSQSSSRSRGRLRKQILLFGISVLIPALVLLFFTFRMNRQDIELRKRRVVEARQQKALEIGQYLANELTRIEREVVQECASDPGNPGTIYHKYPPLVFVGTFIK
jgi:hypothetical protein